MEPFGLFQLLQSVLPAANDTSDNEKSTTNENEREEAVSEVSQPTTYSDAQNAVLGFMEAHDRRAKRLR